MRLSVFPDLSTKDGVTDENARMTNALKEVRAVGDMATIRPGLVTSATSVGNGNGLVSYNGELVSIYGASLGRTFLTGDGNFHSFTMPETANWVDVAWNGTVFCAITSNSDIGAISSDGGTTWSSVTLPSSQQWISIAWNGSLFCIVALNFPSGSTIAATSPDGITWTQRVLPVLDLWRRIAAKNGTFCIVSSKPTGSTNSLVSTDGINWSTGSMPSHSYTGLAASDTVFCATFQSGGCAISSDGLAWSEFSMPDPSAQYYSIAWNGTVFCAIDDQELDISATSPDGITWTPRTMPLADSWIAIAWNGTKFCAVIQSSTTAATSPDGIIWTLIDMPTLEGWEAITADISTGTFVVAPGNSNVGAFTGDYYKTQLIDTVSNAHYDFVQSPL